MSSRHSAADLKQLDSEHYLHPFSNYQEMKEKGSLVIQKADGVWLWTSMAGVFSMAWPGSGV